MVRLRGVLSVIILVVLSIENLTVLADIPVHCVQPDVIGLWRFHVGWTWMDGGWPRVF